MKKIAILLVLILLVSCAPEPVNNTQKTNFEYSEFFAMDTIIRIQIYDNPSKEVFEKFEKRVRDLENLLSPTIQASDIYKINHADGKPTEVSKETFELLKSSINMFTMTNGAFEPTVGKLVASWGIGTDHAKIPTQEEIDEGLKAVDANKITLTEPNLVSIPKGYVIELGAIAKGFAADELAKLADELNVKSVIFNLGGNVFVKGNKNGGDFKVSIQDPFSPQNVFFCTLAGQDFTVVTSGDYERFFEKDGKRYHHILDPLTGFPVNNELKSVSIITKSSTYADGLSTSLFVMGLEKGIEFCKGHPEFEAVFVTKDKEVYITPGLRDRFKLQSKDFTLIE